MPRPVFRQRPHTSLAEFLEADDGVYRSSDREPMNVSPYDSGILLAGLTMINEGPTRLSSTATRQQGR